MEPALKKSRNKDHDLFLTRRTSEFSRAVFIFLSLFLLQVSGGVWSMEKVCLQTQKVGFTCSSMQDKPGCLKNGEEYVPCSCYQPAIFHPHTWRTICCAPDVFGGKYLVLFYRRKLDTWRSVRVERRCILILNRSVFLTRAVSKEFQESNY